MKQSSRRTADIRAAAGRTDGLAEPMRMELPRDLFAIEARDVAVLGPQPGPVRHVGGRGRRNMAATAGSSRGAGHAARSLAPAGAVGALPVPTLVMNLRAGAAGHNPASSLLGFANAVRAGSEPVAGADRISRFLAWIEPR